VQLIQTAELDERSNLWLKELREGVDAESMAAVVERYTKEKYAAEYKAYFDIFARANKQIFLEGEWSPATTRTLAFFKSGAIATQWKARRKWK
jgi:hypothetical protein